jgi:hypothetical protein
MRRRDGRNYSAPGINKWIDHVYPPTTQEEVIQFVRLWEALRGVVPNDMVEDDIRWKWTADGMYTTQKCVPGSVHWSF